MYNEEQRARDWLNEHEDRYRTIPCYEYEVVQHLLSLIDNLRAERGELREAWEPMKEVLKELTAMRFKNFQRLIYDKITVGDLRKLAEKIGKEKP